MGSRRKRALGQLTASVEDGGVRLAFYLTTPVFEAWCDDQPMPQIRIQRERVEGFTLGKDYAEYFDGMDAAAAPILFDGVIEPINGRKFEFLDETVEIGETYAYWVSCPLGQLPTGPAPVKVRDHRVWWPHAVVESRLTAMAEAYPALASLERYGTTVGDHAISGLRVGNQERCVALIGLIHAGESGPELMIPAVERLLADHAELLAQVGVTILPSVNADERERLVRGCPWYLRANGRGVDVNRNFDVDWERVEYGYGFVSSDPSAMTYRGPRPESEPETRAVMAFTKATSPLAVLSYHAMSSITGVRFLAAGEAEHDTNYVRQCHACVEPFIRAFYPEDRWNARIDFGTTAGSLPACMYRRLGIPAFDLEWDGNPDSLPSHTDNTTIELLELYQERHFQGLLGMLTAIAQMPLPVRR